MPAALEDAVQGRDQAEAEFAGLAPMLSGQVSQTVQTKVAPETVKELYHYSLLSLLAYSDDKKKVYAALVQHATDLFELILPAGATAKQEAWLHEDNDKLVRVVLLAGKAPGTAEAVVAFVGPDRLTKRYQPTEKVPVAAPVELLDSWPAAEKNTQDMRIHGSWLLAFNKLVQGERKDGRDLQKEIRKLADKLHVTVNKITCVGHGTGGALATIGAFWMNKITFPEIPVQLVTFGSPRVGNHRFVKAFQKTIPNALRVVHKTDPLSDAPSFLSYEHVGKPVHLYEPQHNDYGAPDMGDGCYVAIYLSPPAPLYSYKVEDNSILKYVEGLQEAAQGANIPGLQEAIKTKWGPFLADRLLGLVDNASADEDELEAMIKQLMKLESGKVQLSDLADDALSERLLKYGAWAKAAYSHHVNEGPDNAMTYLEKVYPKEGPLLSETLRLVQGTSNINGSFFLLFQTDTQALVGLEDDGKGGVELVVAFRGSEKKAGDWLANFSISMTSVHKLLGKDAQVDDSWEIHNGFTEAVNDILRPDPHNHPMVGLSDGESETTDDDKRTRFPDLISIAEHLRALAGGKPITKVVTCGHSLGGALSKLAAYWCQKVGFKTVKVENYSFGAPRIANWEFAQEWRNTVKTAWRVVHRADPVPAIPFTSWLAGFEYFHVDNAVLLCQPGDNPFLAMDWPPVAHKDHYQAQLRRRPAPLTAIAGFTPNVGDHSMGVYLEALGNARDNHPSRMSVMDSLKAQVSHVAAQLSETFSAHLPGHHSVAKGDTAVAKGDTATTTAATQQA